MASSREYLQYVLEQLSELEEITYREMMVKKFITCYIETNVTVRSRMRESRTSGSARG